MPSTAKEKDQTREPIPIKPAQVIYMDGISVKLVGVVALLGIGAIIGMVIVVTVIGIALKIPS